VSVFSHGKINEVTISPISDRDLISDATVYRFFRNDLGVHFYTANKNERDLIQNTLPQFNYEGASFTAIDSSSDSLTGVKPVYRFLNTVQELIFTPLMKLSENLYS